MYPSLPPSIRPSTYRHILLTMCLQRNQTNTEGNGHLNHIWITPIPPSQFNSSVTSKVMFSLLPHLWVRCIFSLDNNCSYIFLRELRSFIVHLFVHTHGLWKFSGQRLNPGHCCELRHRCTNARLWTHCTGLGSNLHLSNDPSCCRDNAGSLTHCTTAGTPIIHIRVTSA